MNLKTSNPSIRYKVVQSARWGQILLWGGPRTGPWTQGTQKGTQKYLLWGQSWLFRGYLTSTCWGHTLGFKQLLHHGFQFLDAFLRSQLCPALFLTSALAFKALTYKPASVWPFQPTLISLLHPGPYYLKSKCWAAAPYDSSCHLGAKHSGEVGPGRNFSVSPFITIKGLFSNSIKQVR